MSELKDRFGRKIKEGMAYYAHTKSMPMRLVYILGVRDGTIHFIYVDEMSLGTSTKDFAFTLTQDFEFDKVIDEKVAYRVFDRIKGTAEVYLYDRQQWHHKEFSWDSVEKVKRRLD